MYMDTWEPVLGAGPLLGIDLSGLVGGGAPGGGSEPAGGTAIENCETGADANADVDCRMAGAQVLEVGGELTLEVVEGPRTVEIIAWRAEKPRRE